MNTSPDARTASSTRVVLVMGNSTYEHTTVLKNPVNDALDAWVTLENLGFSVSRLFDANKGEMRRAVDEFQRQISRKGTEIALLYYAGHGVEYAGNNYIIPVTAELPNEYALMNEAVSLDLITAAMDRAQVAFSMIVLMRRGQDIGSNFARFLRSASRPDGGPSSSGSDLGFRPVRRT